MGSRIVIDGNRLDMEQTQVLEHKCWNIEARRQMLKHKC
jgi:hypothetical protein